MFQSEREELREQVRALQEKNLRIETQMLSAGGSSETAELEMLRRKNAETESRNRELTERLKSLTANAFLSTSDERAASGRQLRTVEEERNKLRIEVETLRDQYKELDDKSKKSEVVNKDNADRVRGLIEQNERMRIQLEDKVARSGMLEEQLKFLQEGLPSQDKAAAEAMLQKVLEMRPSAYLRADPAILERTGASVPSDGSMGEVSRAVDILRREKV